MTAEEMNESPANEMDDNPLEEEKGIFAEFYTFLMENKIWWITPVVLVLLVVGVLIWLGSKDGDTVAPFIYTLF